MGLFKVSVMGGDCLWSDTVFSSEIFCQIFFASGWFFCEKCFNHLKEWWDFLSTDTIDMFGWLIISGMQDMLLSLWKSAQISSLMCLWKLTVATCIWSVKICKSSQGQVSSFHFSERFVTEPVLVFSVRQLLTWSRIHVCQSCWVAM